ncbi:MAG TPA: methyltransferase domain-containing protein [Verrucomicrobiales bacterium]|nr:methyltransferase domain-containing protein [Verrucomicrobiales bacterium]
MIEETLFEMLGSWIAGLASAGRRRRTRRGWEKKWGSPDFKRPWLRRGVSQEVVTAVEEGWFAPGATAIDLGCGEGDVAAWLAGRGFTVLGVDIAAAAIERARARCDAGSARLTFEVHDICAGPPPGGPFQALVDRGCFHQIASRDRPIYRRNVLKVATPDARLLLFHKAFRKGEPLGDSHERRRVTTLVEEGLGGAFSIEKYAETFLDPCHGSDPESALPGLVFWMRRRTEG